MLATILQKLFSRCPALTRKRTASHYRPALEILECRTVPSVVMVTSTSDSLSDTGSLRYAIANATAGETIDFGPDVRTIDLSNTLNSAGLTIGVNLSIINDQGVGPVTIDGGGQFTVFTLANRSVTALLSGLIIAHGNSNPAHLGFQSGGGGILNDGSLSVNNCTFSDNSVSNGDGGGIYNAGALMVCDSSVSNNSATGGGGGIYNAGTLTINNSIFSNNSAGNSGGGGVYNAGSCQLIVNDSTFSSNAAEADSGGSGGGISNFGTLTVSNSTFASNSANGYVGGGISAGGDGTLTINNSTFTNNSAY